MTAPVGLSNSEVQKLQAQFGKNTIESKRKHSAVRLMVRQFSSPITLILIVATVISMFVGDVVSGSIILAIIIPTGLLGYWQEHRTGKVMQSLLKQIAVKVEVIRNDMEVSVPLEEIVPGDLVILRVGDLIPADCVVINSEELLIDQSALTGESFPQEKVSGNERPGAPLAERTSELFFGSHVVGGKGQAKVIKIGKNTEFGALAITASNNTPMTAFERGTLAFGFLLMRTMLALVFGLFIINLSLHKPIIESLLFSLALAVGLTPQLLPVIISVSLSEGAKRMAAKKVLIKRLDAIEDLGVMNVLCTDKTGTLTTGVVELIDATNASGEVDSDVLRWAILNSSLQKGFPNPIDLAIISQSKIHIDSQMLLDEIPYDFERRVLSTLINTEIPLMITKGALESVLAICSTANIKSSQLPIKEVESKIRERFSTLSEQGIRVLGLATKNMPNTNRVNPQDESELVFQGFLTFRDPPKSGVKETVANLHSLGITMYLVTGDNPIVTKAICKEVGLEESKVITGAELAKFSSLELHDRITDFQVFAEITPVAKERIVQALQSRGNVVGFFGDGINDSAALHRADVGISVDTAVDVAKSAASVVLLEKDLEVLIDGVLLGRKTFNNTLKYIRVAVSSAFGNVLSMTIADVILPFLPMLPMQILLLNFLTDFPAISISEDRVDPESIQEPRSWNIRAISRVMLIFGAASTIFDLTTFYVLRTGFHTSEGLFRTGWFIESTLTGLAAMFVLRTRRRFWQSRPGTGLTYASATLAFVTLALPYSPLAGPLDLTRLPINILSAMFLIIILYVAVIEIAKDHWWK